MKRLRFKRLERHRVGGHGDHMRLSFPLPKSPSGKVYQYSPVEYAVPRLFLIGDAPEEHRIADDHRDRIRREPGSGQTVCPYSGYLADDEDFIHFDDVKAIRKRIERAAIDDIQDHLADMARDFNRKQPKGGLISLSMMVSQPSRRPARPLVIRRDLLRDLSCDVCQREYAVYAIALYCPDCGSPNAALHLRREMQLIDEQIELADAQSAAGRDELAFRLLGNAHEDVVTALETTLKTMYRQCVRLNAPDEVHAKCKQKTIGNAFQNIDRIRDKFEQVGIEPFVHLLPDEVEQFAVNIQKRHVIGHNLSMADDRLAEVTRVPAIGSTVPLVGKEISEFSRIGLKVVEQVEHQLVIDS